MVIERVKVGKSKMNCTIRNMIKSDIESLSNGFMNQGWPGREEILARYFLEQKSGEREVLVAEIDGAVAGYVIFCPLLNMVLLQKSIQNYQILMCLSLFEIKGLGINC